MIELELFYKTVEAKIRENHSGYLEREKLTSVELALPAVDELPTGAAWKSLGFFAKIGLKWQHFKQTRVRKKAERNRRELRVADKLLKGYNAGIKKALSVLNTEFKRYNRRLADEPKEVSTYEFNRTVKS